MTGDLQQRQRAERKSPECKLLDPTCAVVAVALLVDVGLVDGESQGGRELVKNNLVGQPEALHDVVFDGDVLVKDDARV